MRDKKFSSIGQDLTSEIKAGSTYKTNRKIKRIVIHCSFSPQGRGDDAFDIDKWHLQKGWSGIGYHYVVLEDGRIIKGRWVDSPGSHAKGYNNDSIGICRIGGMGKDGRAVDDTTDAQEKSLAMLSKLLISKSMYDLQPEDVIGHTELPKVNKSCPLTNMDKLRNLLV